MTFGILALGFPVSEVLQLLQPLGAHSLTFFPIYLPYLHAFLRWRLASWLWGSLFCSFCSLWGLIVSLSSLYIFPIFMHSLGDVWHPGSGVPCFGGFAAFAAFGGSQSHFLPYIFPIFMHSLGDVWHPGSGVPCFGGFAAFAAFGGSQSHFLPYIFPIFMHSLGDVWHPGSGVPYLTAFLRWRLASWLWGSLFRRFCSFCSLWGLTVSLSSLYIFPIFMHSLGDVWHPGSGVPCFGGFAAFAAFGGSQSHFLPYIFPIFPIPYLHAFLRWRLASWLRGSLFRMFCSFCSLWGLTVSLSSLYLPYLTAFLRWRLASWLWGSLFRRFCSFCSLWGLTVSLSSLYLPYLPYSLSSCIP